MYAVVQLILVCLNVLCVGYIPHQQEIIYLYHAQGYSDPPDFRHVTRREICPSNTAI